MSEEFLAPARKTDSPTKGGIKYKPLEGRVFENKFDERQVSRVIPKAEKGKRKKKKDDYERVSIPRPTAEKYEYRCTSCGNVEERYASLPLDGEGTYFCRDCTRGNGNRRPVKRG